MFDLLLLVDEAIGISQKLDPETAVLAVTTGSFVISLLVLLCAVRVLIKRRSARRYSKHPTKRNSGAAARMRKRDGSVPHTKLSTADTAADEGSRNEHSADRLDDRGASRPHHNHKSPERSTRKKRSKGMRSGPKYENVTDEPDVAFDLD